jgi:hypothetical protein
MAEALTRLAHGALLDAAKLPELQQVGIIALAHSRRC